MHQNQSDVDHPKSNNAFDKTMHLTNEETCKTL